MRHPFSAKFVWCLLFFALASSFGTLNAAPADSLSTAYKKIDSVSRKVDTLRNKMDSAGKDIKDLTSALKKDTTKPACTTCIPNPNGTVDGLGWIIVFLPAAFFLFLLIWLMRTGLKDFSLKEAMSENTYPTILEDNPQYTAANLTALAARDNLDEVIPPTIEKTYLQLNPKTNRLEPPLPNPSISRYIAFITSILTLVVVLGVACFYIYHYIRTGCPPELTGISTLLIALGIGVLPYVFNKLAGAIGKSKEDTN